MEIIKCLYAKSAQVARFPLSWLGSAQLVVLCAPVPRGLLRPGVTLDVSSSTCLHSIASKAVMSAIVSLGQYKAGNLDEP